jgi:hypothetical protein
MLFFALTLGFFVENRREHHVEHIRAKEFAKMLKADLIEDTIQINKLLEYNNSIKGTLDIFTEYYNTPIEKITFGQFKMAESSTYDIGTFIRNDATYSQMKSSGSLRYFKKADLIRKLALYESELKNLDAFWQTALQNHGGLNSEHMLQHGLAAENFLKKNATLNPETLISTAGYKFQSWQEATLITMSLVNGIVELCNAYPNIKKTIIEIIELLNKEYHLK